MQCRHYLVSGKVQGVFYRASTQDKARQLGLTGWVKNLPNGDVEVLACGEQDVLETLESWLQTGPPMAKVNSLKAENCPAQKFSGFEIGY